MLSKMKATPNLPHKKLIAQERTTCLILKILLSKESNRNNKKSKRIKKVKSKRKTKRKKIWEMLICKTQMISNNLKLKMMEWTLRWTKMLIYKEGQPVKKELQMKKK